MLCEHVLSQLVHAVVHPLVHVVRFVSHLFVHPGFEHPFTQVACVDSHDVLQLDAVARQAAVHPPSPLASVLASPPLS